MKSHAVFVVGLALLGVTNGCSEPKTDPLPMRAEVKSVAVRFDHPKLDDVEFEATAEQWEQIRAQLLPATVDDDPASWEWYATIKFTKKDDSRFRLELYSTSKNPGAFAAGPTFKDRIYYRGGDSKGMQKAIMDAFMKAPRVPFAELP